MDENKISSDKLFFNTTVPTRMLKLFIILCSNKVKQCTTLNVPIQVACLLCVGLYVMIDEIIDLHTNNYTQFI